MKRIFKYATMFAAALTLTCGMTACGDDKNEDNTTTPVNPTPSNPDTPDTPDTPSDPWANADANSLEYNSAYGEQWANYMVTVANLLANDATTLAESWTGGYADIFKNHNSDEYKSAIECVEQIFDGCIDIAGEVGDAKIGEPYTLYTSGKTTEALYAVESWYSWHSREDYRNNIYSIRNSYYGNIYEEGGDIAYDEVDENSISAVLAKKNPELDKKAKELIKAAADAIMAIPDPFRNNINAPEVVVAMDACAELGSFIDEQLKPYFQENINDDATLDPIVKQYVDGIVVPTYTKLAALNTNLKAAVDKFKATPSDENFAACAEAWLEARVPWESSEAFLFGPVDELGLDPNMDSWPLDQAQILEILKSQDFTNLNWKEGESDDDIEAAQSLRGFHTLEYLIFKDGKPRTVK